MAIPVRVGDVLRLIEADYRYGVGPLVLRVTEVLGTNLGDEWVELRGIALASNGQEIGQRVAAVRVSALKSARKHRGDL